VTYITYQCDGRPEAGSYSTETTIKYAYMDVIWYDYKDAYTEVGGRATHDYRDMGGRVTPGAVTEEAKAEQQSSYYRVV